MKICEFTAEQLEQKLRNNETGIFSHVGLIRTPMEQALLLLIASLETVNKAGLEGKRLYDLRLITKLDPPRFHEGAIFEIHAKVEHRLAPRPSTEASAP